MEKVETKPLALRKKKKRGECRVDWPGLERGLAPNLNWLHMEITVRDRQAADRAPICQECHSHKQKTSDLEVFTKKPDLPMTPTGVPGFLLMNHNPEHIPPLTCLLQLVLSAQPASPAFLKLYSAKQCPGLVWSPL